MKKIYLLLILLFLNNNCVYAKNITPKEFLIDNNIYGTWKIVGFQDAFYITNSKDENEIKSNINRTIVIGKDFIDYLGNKEIFKNKLEFEYKICEDREGEYCNNYTIRMMAIGKIKKIINLNIILPENNLNFYGFDMYIFNDNTYKVLMQTDGGYYILQKLLLGQ